MNHLERNCEGIDAAVFNGDVLWGNEGREMLKMYIGRWTRAIEENERLAAEEATGETK